MAEKENLKNTLLIDGTEYNINAVYSGEAGKVTTPLVIKESDDFVGVYNGNANEGNAKTEINYVPATGGTFKGPVHIDNGYINNDTGVTDLAGVDANAIINYGQITSKIADLTGAPLYTLNDKYQIHSLTDTTNSADYRLNTLIGTTQGLKVLKSFLSNGSKGVIHTSPVGYYTCKITGLEDEYDANVVIPTKYGQWKVTEISASAFLDKEGITSVILPSSVEIIGENTFNGSAFKGCTNLVSINIPPAVKAIYRSAFQGCCSLESIIIPEGVTSIYDKAFYDCTKLSSVVIPVSIGLRTDSLGENIFDTAEPGPIADLTIYYTGTEEQWIDLLKKNNIISVDASGNISAGTKQNTRIIDAINNDRIIYNYKRIPSVGALNDVTKFIDNPVLYICKDPETASSPVSNKMFLKLPGNTADFIEISKGAARLESPAEATTKGYYTYETLAAIIAGINSRLTALGSTALSLPETLKVASTEHVIVPEIPDEIITTNNNVIVEETVVPSVLDLQQNKQDKILVCSFDTNGDPDFPANARIGDICIVIAPDD